MSCNGFPIRIPTCVFVRSVWKQILKIGAPKTVAAPHGWPDAAEQCLRHCSVWPRRPRIPAQCGRTGHRCRRRRHGAMVTIRRLAAPGLSIGFHCHRSTPPSQPSYAGILYSRLSSIDNYFVRFSFLNYLLIVRFLKELWIINLLIYCLFFFPLLQFLLCPCCISCGNLFLRSSVSIIWEIIMDTRTAGHFLPFLHLFRYCWLTCYLPSILLDEVIRVC